MTNRDKIILSRILTAQNGPKKKARDTMTKPLGILTRFWRGMGTLAQKAAKGYFDQGPTHPRLSILSRNLSAWNLSRKTTLKTRKENDR